MARILVVDDDPVVVTVLEEMLTSAGHQVLRAYDLPHGIASTKSQSPDLVIVDIEMPTGQPTGLELLKQIKAHNHAIAVVMITGDASSQRVMAALRGGAQDMIEKPFTFREVRKRINSALLKQKVASAY